MTVIENDFLRAAISPVGAELKSLVLKKDNAPVIWEGNPEIWEDSSPWLFPVVGRLKNGFFSYKGQKYKPGMHGFARNNLFEANQLAAQKVVFKMHETPETLLLYPWPFELEISYQMQGEALVITARVFNKGEETMPFSLGAHPGFYAAPGDYLIFDENEDLPIYRLDPTLELLAVTVDEYLSGKELRLDKCLFDEDAIILKQPKSQSIKLVRSGAPSVILHFPKVPYLGLWCKPHENIPYICIEPWYGVDDSVDSDTDIMHKEGINYLKVGAEFSMEIVIEIPTESSG